MKVHGEKKNRQKDLLIRTIRRKDKEDYQNYINKNRSKVRYLHMRFSCVNREYKRADESPKTGSRHKVGLQQKKENTLN